jgi:glyoxylate/hydroxypyruvate reductase A
MKVVFCAPEIDPAPWVDRLAQLLSDAEVWAWQRGVPQPAADVAVVWVPGAEFFASQPALRALFNMGAGVDRLLTLPTLPRHLPIFRLDDAGKAQQMAEYVSHALLTHTRRFDDYARQQREHRWVMLPREGPAAFPVGVMGLGAIGAPVAQMIARLGYPVAGWSRSAKQVEGVRCVAGIAALDEFLRASRVLVCVLPLTAETQGILNARRLGLLKPKALVINVGRSGHLVEDDLIPLLESGHLAGAVLDVFACEPLPEAHPFWSHPKIRITPHVAADTALDDSLARVAAQISAFARGKTPTGLVDRDRGY